MTVQIIKVSTGEELIGKVNDVQVPEGQQFVQIEKPAVVILVPDEQTQGKFGIGLAPYAPYAEKNTVNIMPNHIVAIFNPATSLLNEYNLHYGSKVIVPETEIKV